MNVKSFLKTAYLAIVVLSLAGCGPDILESEKVEIIRVADAVAKAQEDKNVKKMMSFLSRDVVITAPDANNKTMNLSYQSYKDYMTQVFPLVTDYKYTRSDDGVSKTKDNLYQLKTTVAEEFTVDSQKYKETTKQVWTLKDTADGLIVTKIVATKK